MRYLGLDLGTKTLGISKTDRSGTIVSPLPVIKFSFEDYDSALDSVLKVISDNNVDKVVLGLPKNMDGTIGFAGERSLKFKEMLESKNIVVELEDERLTTKVAENIIHENNSNIKSSKNKIDSISAVVILESFLKRIKNDIKE